MNCKKLDEMTQCGTGIITKADQIVLVSAGALPSS